MEGTMVTAGELRKGLTVEIDGELVRVLDYQHVKQGRGSAFVRLSMRNLRTGSITERTFQATTRFQQARLERSTVQYLYADGDAYYFMNTETFEQLMLPQAILGDAMKYLRENDTIDRQSGRDTDRARLSRRYRHRWHQAGRRGNGPDSECTALCQRGGCHQG
jgi:translation elongation factor P/translation initiation factor 5A